MDNNEVIFDLPKNNSNIIKVVGVGGGGSNAINHMYHQGIKGVDFVVCNTDAQALESSPIANKLNLGMGLTEGLGAGGKPEVGEKAALESINLIEESLGDLTKMVFVTAGMGGGTGTGAAPIIAKTAKDKGILTIGIVTQPFKFEGEVRNSLALEGIEKMRKSVDALIVINNNKLREVYGSLGFKSGFAKADEVLLNAAKGIAEVISYHYLMNIDLCDVKTVLSDSGFAIMGSATASGDNRAKEAIEKAINSPLIENNSILGTDDALLLVTSGSKEVTIEEMGLISEYIHENAKKNVNIITGLGEDPSLGDAISVTITATGIKRQLESKEIEKSTTHTSSVSRDFEEEVSSESEASSFSKDEDLSYRDPTGDSYHKNKKSTEVMISRDGEFIFTEEPSEEENTTTDQMSQSEIDFDRPIPLKKDEEKISKDLTLEETTHQSDLFPEYHNQSEGETLESHQVSRAEIKLTIQKKESIDESQENNHIEDINPINNTIEDMLKRKRYRQRENIQNFNLKYQSSNVYKMEKEPAYKRQGIDISRQERQEIDISNSSLSLDKNNKLCIRSNNSFLHDNVD